MDLHLRGFVVVERLAAVPGGGCVVRESAGGERVGGGGFVAVFGFAVVAVAVGVFAVLFVAAAFGDGVQSVGGAVRGREVIGSAGSGGEGVEAALEEFVVGAGEGEVLWC